MYDTKAIAATKLSDSRTSSDTQGQLAGARGNKSGKEMQRRRFTSKAEKSFRLTCKLATLTAPGSLTMIQERFPCDF